MAQNMTQAPPQQNAQLLPGSRFSIPPFTDEVEQPENNDQLVTTMAANSQVPVTGVIPFMQSDVVYGWVYEITMTATMTTAGTLTASQYGLWIEVGPLLLNMQYQYPSISVATGYDLSLVNGYRPIVEANRGIAHFKSPIVDAPSSQANQNYTALANATTTVPQNTAGILELPAACWFDSYYELDETGLPVSGPHNGFVSPQNMGGYARVVTPSVRLNQLWSTAAGSNDSSVWFAAGGSPTVTTGSMTHGFSRIGVLGSLDQSVLPQPTNWQYNIAHQQVAIAGVSKATIPLNGIFAGQIMSIVCRLFDPSAANGGAPIAVSNVTNYQLQYGGSVVRFAGGIGTSIKRLQRRFMEQHLYLPGEGVMILDMALDRYIGVTNSYCLNTLRTAAVQLNLQFQSALSTTAYCEVTIEGLRWVPLPVNPAQ